MTPPSAEFDVRLDRVSKTFGAVTAVQETTLDIPRGTFLSILGPSGCGKTTTLRMIAGFERPTTGNVYIRGERVTEVPPYKRDFSMVFQNFALFPHLDVAQNVGFGLRMRGLPRADIDREVASVLDLVKLSGLADRFPRQLSGGQQQRVALARAIVMSPAVMLLDEPLGALDKNLREEMQIELRQLQQKLGITAVFVTHDQDEALTLSDRIAVMRDGRIEQIGAPRDVYERPANEFVAGFFGVSNVMNGEVVHVDPDGVDIRIGEAGTVRLSFVAEPGRRIRVAVRPEKIRIARSNAGLPLKATLTDVVYRGASTSFFLELDGQTLVAIRQNEGGREEGLKAGDAIVCGWDPDSAIKLADG
jgi:spermidine/putrescine ABC transporter ATP-binding subunit